MDTILVNIYEVPCLITLRSLYETSDHPENIFVGYGTEGKKEKITIFPEKHPLHILAQNNQILVEKPDVFRDSPDFYFFVGTMILTQKSTTFFLQIKSHTLFTPKWDSRLIREIKNLNISSVFSYDPLDISEMNSSPLTVPILHKIKKIEKDYFCIDKSNLRVHSYHPIQTFLISHHFFFCYSQLWKKIQPNPYLRWNACDNILLSGRLFTHGIDVFTPWWNVVFIRHEKQSIPTKINKTDSLIKDILQNKNISKTDYGLGTKNNIQIFFQQVGIKDVPHYENIHYNPFLFFLWIPLFLILLLTICFIMKNS